MATEAKDGYGVLKKPHSTGGWFSRGIIRSVAGRAERAAERAAETVGLSYWLFCRDVPPEQRRLYRFLDGELDEVSANQFKAEANKQELTEAMAEGVALNKALNSALNSALNNWMGGHSGASAAPKRVDLWAAIESQLDAAPPTAVGRTVLAERLFDILSTSRSLNMPQFAASFAMVLFLGIAVGWKFRELRSGPAGIGELAKSSGPSRGPATAKIENKDGQPAATQVAALNYLAEAKPVDRQLPAGSQDTARQHLDEEELRIEERQLRRQQELSRRSIGAESAGFAAAAGANNGGSSERVIVADSGAHGSADGAQSAFYGKLKLASRTAARTAPFERSVPLHINTSQLISQPLVPDGLRTDGMSIEWIRTERPFRIVSSNGRKAPPVIWVSR